MLILMPHNLSRNMEHLKSGVLASLQVQALSAGGNHNSASGRHDGGRLQASLFLLRCVELAAFVGDLDLLSTGLVLDMQTENFAGDLPWGEGVMRSAAKLADKVG